MIVVAIKSSNYMVDIRVYISLAPLWYVTYFKKMAT